jgi:hypothetical protein
LILTHTHISVGEITVFSYSFTTGASPHLPRFLPPHGAQSQPDDLVAAQWAEVRMEIGGG